MTETVDMFYVAMSGPDAASAACVADDKDIVREFYRDHYGAEIRKVPGGVMRMLLAAYIETRNQKNA